MTKFAFAVAALLVSMTAAIAAPPTSLTVIGVARDTGSEAIPHFNGQTATVTYHDLLPANGSEGVEQSANSLPAGFTDGTGPQIQAAIMARYFAAQTARSGHVALAAR